MRTETGSSCKHFTISVTGESGQPFFLANSRPVAKGLLSIAKADKADPLMAITPLRKPANKTNHIIKSGLIKLKEELKN